VVTSIKRRGRGDKKTFEVIDNTIMKRIIELLNRGLVIQSEALNRLMQRSTFQHESIETSGEVLASIVI